MSRVCTVCFAREFVSKRGRDFSIISDVHSIERYALNTKGDVGSFYNAWTDDILIHPSIDKKLLTRKQVQQTPFCKLIQVMDQSCHNILKLLRIDDELRITAALNMMTTTQGISDLYLYQAPVNRTIRLISYCRIDQEEYLPNNQRVREILPHSLPDQDVTHVITGVNRGIDFVMVLELPDNADEDEIDLILEKLCECFRRSDGDFLSMEDQQKIDCLRPILFTSISDIRSFAKNEDCSRTYQQIHQYINENRGECPIFYTLHPVKCIYSDESMNNRNYHTLNLEIALKVEETLFRVSNRFTQLQYLFNEKIKSQSSPSLQSRVESIFNELNQLRHAYTEIQQVLAAKVCSFRQGEFHLSLLKTAFDDPNFVKFTSDMEALHTEILKLINTISASKKLQTGLEEPIDDQNILEDTSERAESDCDHLRKLCKELPRKAALTNPVFADFAFCGSKPESIKILRPKLRSIVKDNEINILLVGESGVGKSTFINAFVNYLAFSSLQQATDGKPMVLIPVSFMITVGDHFQEKLIEFGQFDANENHNQIGQSVTQYCKSYTFSTRKHVRLRIIDTPGFGDTRGVEQDDQNIDHILSYISQLSHLNAICFLLKPSVARLHSSFRSCFMQLMNFFGTDVRDNIIFCFTNTRSTFYTPGDTSTLVKSMLAELSDEQRPLFDRKNTFCFDSEAFRYLAMVQQEPALAFTGGEKVDFEKSWQISGNESNRLFDSLGSYKEISTDQLHSINHAQMMIRSLIRPILETIRNSLRNIILYQLNDKRCIIEIKPQPISLPAWLCMNCPYEVIPMGDISIAKYQVHYHRTPDRCDCCQHAPTQYLSVFYESNYQFRSVEDTGFLEETVDVKDRLLRASAKLSQFLLSTMGKSEDLFLSWFDLLIKQEEYLHSEKPLSVPNNHFYKELYDAKVKYTSYLQEIQSHPIQTELNPVYQCLEGILIIPCIETQLTAIKASQMKILQTNEYDVSSQYPQMNKFF